MGQFGRTLGPSLRTAVSMTVGQSACRLVPAALSSHVPTWRGAGDGARTHDIQLGKLARFRGCAGVRGGQGASEGDM
jgi:hypothetical protein